MKKNIFFIYINKKINNYIYNKNKFEIKFNY